MFILKHFKSWKIRKGLTKENDDQILLKIGFLMNLSKRKSKDEDLKKLKLFRNLEIGKTIWKPGIGKLF